RMLEAKFGPLVPVEEATGGSLRGPATELRFADGRGRIGFIPTVGQPFCASCDRFRLTADGKLRSCLFSLDEVDLRGPLRAGADDDALADVLRGAILAKGPGHEINTAAFRRPERSMSAIGG
ncbi:MAG: GTP 3',8-cyclase MoaA, partial [Planctomycetota bacterium]